MAIGALSPCMLANATAQGLSHCRYRGLGTLTLTLTNKTPNLT